MRYKRYVISKVLKKALFLLLLPLILALNVTIKLLQLVFRFIIMPVSIVSSCAGLIYMLSAKELDTTAISVLVLLAVAALMTYTLPYVSFYLESALITLKFDLTQPIIPKPPVRYTL